MNVATGTITSIDEVRNQFRHVADLAYFNTGTFGTMAQCVLERVLERIAYFEQQSFNVYGEIIDEVEVVRGRIARRIGGKADEISLTRHATDGVNYVVAGIDWNPDDEVIISDQEHPAMNFPWEWAAARKGIKVRRFQVAHDPAETLANALALVTDKTRLIGASWVTSPYGIRLPARELCAAARERGLLSLVDGAQAFAITSVDVGELGCDYFTTNGHKWLGGPKGTGFFWARLDRMLELKPAYVGAGSLARYHETEGVELQPNGKRFEFATTAHALWAGLGPALDWFDQLGWEWIERRTAELSSYLKAGLAEIPGVTLKTPHEWARSSGLTAFELVGADSNALMQHLETDYRVKPRPLHWPGHIRVSTAYFNIHEEIDRLLAGVRSFRPS